MQYLHGFWFIPTPRTFLKSINSVNFLTWPNLNNPRLLKHILLRIATILGHLDQEQKNLQLTKPVKYALYIEGDKDFYPIMESVKIY